MRVIEEAAGAMGGARGAIRGRWLEQGLSGSPKLSWRGGVSVTHNARKQARDGVYDQGGGKFAAGENEVSDGKAHGHRGVGGTRSSTPS